MAERILGELFPRIESLTLLPSSGGAFEVTLNDELIYSKRKTGTFPNDDELAAEIARRLGF